jgi:hypothetical protein
VACSRNPNLSLPTRGPSSPNAAVAEVKSTLQDKDGRPSVEEVAKTGKEDVIEDADLLRQGMADWADGSLARPARLAKLIEYLRRHPDSSFAAEIYCWLGHAYGPNRHGGETSDKALRNKYYRKARALYGNQYASRNATIWETLTNERETSIDDRIQHFSWLFRLKHHGTHKDVYPVRNIWLALKWKSITLSVEERASIIEFFKKRNLKNFIYTATENKLAALKGDSIGLGKLAEAFPDEEVGKRAAKARKKLLGI